MNHSDCKIHYASKQKRVIALQDNRQKPWQAPPLSPSEQRVALPLSHTSLLDFGCKGTIPLCSLSA